MKLSWWKVVLFTGLIVMVSAVGGLTVSELVIRKFLPQVTFAQASLAMLPAFAESGEIPFTLEKNVFARYVAPNNEFDVEMSTNLMGYRGDEFSKEKEPGVYRILFVGDSMTFGVGVYDNQVFTKLFVDGEVESE